jgi:hypothetical protein
MAFGISAGANGTIRDDWLATYPDVCGALTDAANNCSLCHDGVPSLNPYGSDLAANGNDPEAIEALDSDGDTRTNLQEITMDCTLPGDATSVPNTPQTWTSVRALFR